MINVDIPAIPSEVLEELNKKTFGASDIKWIKTVNDDSIRNLSSSSAYLPPDPRVINENGVFFCLQANNGFQNSLNKANIGDIIVLYQKLENQSTKCFTHLVTPIGYRVVPCPYAAGGWNGRWVKVIAMTENKVANSIPALTAEWKNMPFKNALGNLGYQNGAICKIANSKNLSGVPLSNEELSNLQNYIWEKFEKWR